uniref:Uncharacterized protein n=1 Tax=Triticum urartu TaxID=4572 RepID=A0A8R7PZ40_TRIUA
MSMPVRGSGNLLSVNCDSNRVNAWMGCRIQLSPTSCTWILPGRAVASADKLLYETRRVGIGAAASGRMLCPNRANALEKAICGFAKNP